MKRRNLLQGLVLPLTTTLLLASCATPGVKEAKKPLAETAELARLLNPDKLTPETRDYLKEQGLYTTYRKDRSDAVAALRQRLADDASYADRMALIELCSDIGDQVAAEDPHKAVGYHLAAADLAATGAIDAVSSAESAHRHELVAAYNHSAGQVTRILFDSGQSWDQAVAVAGPWKEYRLRFRTTGEGMIDPAFFDHMVPAEYLKVKGIESEARKRQRGIGAAMVGHREGTEERRVDEPFLGSAGMSLPVSAVLDFSGNRTDVALLLFDGMVKDSVQLGGRTVPLGIDFTAPLITLYNYVPKGNVGWKGMLHPDEYAAKSSLVLTEPFRSGQIPVVLVHGLMSSPLTWVRAINELRADPVLRKKYQLLVFYYPTGFPITYSAASLRKRLAKFREHYDPRRGNPNMRRMVMIGHSMGGMLTNLQIRNSGDTLMELIFTRPLDEIDLTEAEKEALRELTLFEANPDIERAVFVAAPHRGSDIASNPIGKLGSTLVRIPANLTQAEPLRLVDGMTDLGVYLATHQPDGIKGLQPNHPVFTTVLELPTDGRVQTHSVIGNHKPAKLLEKSSDMVVPYWSSHLDDVDSEKVVEATHTTITGNTEAIEEMRRILYLHAGLGEPE